MKFTRGQVNLIDAELSIIPLLQTWMKFGHELTANILTVLSIVPLLQTWMKSARSCDIASSLFPFNRPLAANLDEILPFKVQSQCAL